MTFILGIIIGILLTLSTVIMSIYLDGKGKNVVKYLQEIAPKEQGYIIDNSEEVTDKFIKTFTKSQEL